MDVLIIIFLNELIFHMFPWSRYIYINISVVLGVPGLTTRRVFSSVGEIRDVFVSSHESCMGESTLAPVSWKITLYR